MNTYQMGEDFSYQDSLDVEQHQILSIIKPCVLNVNDWHLLEVYRVWLERLSGECHGEKLIRNQYLIELANQIHDQVVRPPFTLRPPIGPLQRLKKYKRETEWTYHVEATPIAAPPSMTPPKSVRKRILKTKSSRSAVKKSAFKSETSSWCDMSECSTISTTNLASGDTDAPEEKFYRKLEEELGAEPRFQSTNPEEPAFDIKQFFDIETNAGAAMNPTEQEVEALKLRVKDLLEVKNALKDTHCLTEDRKKTMEMLQQRVAEVDKEKDDLKTALSVQMKKMVELDLRKTKEFGDFRERFTLLRRKELNFMRRKHEEEMEECEKNLQAVKAKHNEEVEKIRKEYEERIEEREKLNMELLRSKVEEIERFKEMCKSTNSESEHHSEQVVHLKRCVSKLDKLLHRNEKENLVQLEKLRKEMEMKEMSFQIELKTQRAQLLARCTSEKQDELKSALNSLETKYKKMMETLQAHCVSAREHDAQIIKELRDLLYKHDIAYS